MVMLDLDDFVVWEFFFIKNVMILIIIGLKFWYQILEDRKGVK